MSNRKPHRISASKRHFYAQLALAPELKRELESVKREKTLARMMNCKTVDKFDRGEHTYQPVKKSNPAKFLDLNAAALYLRTGAVLLSDCVSKERLIMSPDGRIYGQIRNNVMLKLFGKYGFDSEKIHGTNKTKYRIA